MCAKIFLVCCQITCEWAKPWMISWLLTNAVLNVLKHLLISPPSSPSLHGLRHTVCKVRMTFAHTFGRRHIRRIAIHALPCLIGLSETGPALHLLHSHDPRIRRRRRDPS